MRVRPGAAMPSPNCPLMNRIERRVALLAMVVAAFGYLAWEVMHRGIYQYSTSAYGFDDADEWRYTACSRLVAHGYGLFDQVFSAQPPLLFASLAAGMRLSGDSILGARWVEIVFGLVSLICASLVAWLLADGLAAAACALLLAVSPGFLVYSHTVEAEGPMMAMVTLSLLLAATYWRTSRLPLASLAGLALAAAVLLKLFAVEAVLPGLWVLTLATGSARKRVFALLLYGLSALVPVGAEFLLLQPTDQWQQVVAMHDRAAQINFGGALPLSLLSQFLGFDFGLTLLSVGGFVVLIASRRWKDLGFLTLWLPGSMGMMLLFRPLFPHHLAILLTGLAVSGGVGSSGIARGVLEYRRGWIALAVIAGAAYIVLLPRTLQRDRHTLIAENRPFTARVTKYLDVHSSTADIVVVDDLEAADRAQRLVAPPLCDPSNVRLRAGYLTANQAIAATERYAVRIVVPTTGLYHQLPGYIDWLRTHFEPRSLSPGFSAYVHTRHRVP